jgi:hypothetical protein
MWFREISSLSSFPNAGATNLLSNLGSRFCSHRLGASQRLHEFAAKCRARWTYYHGPKRVDSAASIFREALSP